MAWRRLQSNVVEVVLGRNDSVLLLLGRASHALAQAGAVRLSSNEDGNSVIVSVFNT